jgi:uncharacterized phage-associated protein
MPKGSDSTPPVPEQAVTVLDVAAAILERKGPMDALKLQKLVYYAQAWHLAWYGEPFFTGSLQAWKQGPVSRELWKEHERQAVVQRIPSGSSERLSERRSLALDAVLARYGKYPAFQLADLTHREDPWARTRGDLPPGYGSDQVISEDLMRDYYRETGGIDLQPSPVEPSSELLEQIRAGDAQGIAAYLSEVSNGRVSVTQAE